MNDPTDFDVEILADFLGLWHDPRREDARHTAFVVGGRDLLWVSESGVETIVDARMCALMSLGIWAGLRVDLGECPACRERGSKRGLARWEWYRFDPLQKYGSYGGNGLRPDGWTVEHVLVTTAGGGIMHGLIASRPCPACTVEGEPTGRESLDWASAIVQAMPKTGESEVTVESHGELGHERREVWYPPEPGDQRIREALAVLADHLQREPDPPCPDCDGVARPSDDNVPPCRSCSVGRCPVCGEVLRAGEPCSITLHGMTAPPEWTRSTGKDHRAGERRRTLGVLVSAWLDGPDVLANHLELGALVRDVADEIVDAWRPPVGPIARIADAR